MLRTTLTTGLAVVGAFALLVGPPPAAATGATFKGKTSQNRTVTLKLSGSSIKRFSAGINMMCIQDGLEFNAVIPPRAMKVKRGKFSYRGRDVTDGTNIRIAGTISGSMVKGTIRMTDSRYNAADASFDSCVGSARFTARRR